MKEKLIAAATKDYGEEAISQLTPEQLDECFKKTLKMRDELAMELGDVPYENVENGFCNLLAIDYGVRRGKRG